MLNLPSQTHDPNKKHYFTQLQKDQSDQLYHDLKKHGHQVTVWKQGEEQKAEKYAIEVIEGVEKRPVIKLRKEGGLLSKISGSALIDQEVLIKFPLEKYTYFTVSTLRYDPETSLYTLALEEDDKIFRSQQRSNYRLTASFFIKIQLKINETVYQCDDISAGGTSFTLKEEDSTQFHKDQIIRDCPLLFNRKKFEIPTLKIAGIFPNKDANGKQISGVKVGVAFIDLPHKTEESLTIHINSEARAEEIQRRFSKKNRPKFDK